MQKAVNSERTRNYLRESKVELWDILGEQSIASATTAEKDKSKVNTQELLEKILERRNLNLAYQRVVRNGGSHGVDGMQVNALLPYLKQNGSSLQQAIREGKYRPQPVRRVEIPKADGGVRLLGIPTVVDRMLQQAIHQILDPIFDKEFSKHSYGFRAGRNAHQAVKQAQEYQNAGYKVVVDLDLEKFFDKVNHDKLMYLLSEKIADKRVLKLIRLYLASGIMINGVVTQTEEGTPQGGPLSPLLSNVMLDELDKELEQRGHKFCRYADDCNIYVKSHRAGERVMKSLTKWIEDRLKLKVNRTKSAVDYPSKRKFLGFSFYRSKEGVRVRIHPKPLERFKEKVRTITSRSNGTSIETRISKLNQLLIGWVHYFKIADIKGHCQRLDEWIRRRLRMCYWKDWKKIKTKYENLKRLGLPETKSWEYANSRKGYWRIAGSVILDKTITNQFLEKIGYRTLTIVYSKT
jgi:group II intron reverse transcriptase/maturase